MDALEHNEDAASSWSSDYSSEDEHSYPMMHELVWLLAFDSQEWRPPWPPSSNLSRWYMVPWCVRVYATQARSCSLLRIHGYSILHRYDPDQSNMCCSEYAYTIGTNCFRALAQIELSEFQPPRLWVPSAVPHRCTSAFRHNDPMGHWELTYSQWCDATCPSARNLPLCLPNTTTWPVVKLPEVLRQYRKARRPAAPAAPATDAQSLQQGLADMQMTLARIREAQDVDGATTMQADSMVKMHQTLAMRSELDRIAQGLAPAVAMHQGLQELQAQANSTNALVDHIAQDLASAVAMHQDVQELQARANSTTALVALPASLTSVGRQAPWSGASLAPPPWALVLPASSSPVTSQDVTEDVKRTQLHALVVTTTSLVRESRTLDADTAAWAYGLLRLSLFRQWHSNARAHLAHSRWRASKKGRAARAPRRRK